jgi:flagellar basal body-associated protein FliL
VGRALIAALAAAALLAGCGADRAPAVKVDSTVVVLDDDVIVDLEGGGYATITVGLEVRDGTDTAEAQAGLVREVVTRDLTGLDRASLLDHERRESLKLKLARDIRKRTDIALDGVLLTDLTIK